MALSINDYYYSLDEFYCKKDIDPENIPEEEMYTMFVFKTKIEGQIVEVQIDCDERNNCPSRTRHWNIGLTIGTKRKHFEKYHDHKEVCGKIGLKGLLFAKAAIQYFEDYLKNTKYKNYKNILYATWLDNRRRDAYAYGLKKLGFNFGIYDKKKVLLKEVI